MDRTHLAIGIAALSVLFAAPAFAGVALSEGSRWDVRGWCAVHGGVITDGADYTTCISATVPGVAFTCDDAGACSRIGFDLIQTGGTVPAPVRLQDIVPNNHYLPHHYTE